jgi:chemotaxis protein CheZ
MEVVLQVLRDRDEAAFAAALVAFHAAHDSTLLHNVDAVARNLRAALDRFGADSRLAKLADHDVPDARHRLAHVMDLTESAAHRTMDLIDECGVLVDGVTRTLGPPASRSPEVAAALPGLAALRQRLAEMLIAQGFQDLSGQIIRSVMQLIDELESALGDLMAIGGGRGTTSRAADPSDTTPVGPVVPGVAHGNAVSGQQDVDALLSGLGI